MTTTGSRGGTRRPFLPATNANKQGSFTMTTTGRGGTILAFAIVGVLATITVSNMEWSPTLPSMMVRKKDDRHLSNANDGAVTKEELKSLLDTMEQRLQTNYAMVGQTTTSQQEQRQRAVDGGGGSKSTSKKLHRGCTPLQKRLTKKILSEGANIHEATKCPQQDKWLSSYLEDFDNSISSSNSGNNTFVFLNFGCNKGYDAVDIARKVSWNVDVFNKQEWAISLGDIETRSCPQDNMDAAIILDDDHQLLRTRRPVQVHCVEAIPITVQHLIQAATITNANQHGLHIHNFAMTGTPGGAPILFPNPKDRAGIEYLNLESCRNNHCEEVPTRTVDEFVQEFVDGGGKTAATTRSSDLEKDQQQQRRRIDYMMIDVEGFDFTVMKGAKETLQRTDYLEFEYHNYGDWNRQKLQDALKMLEDDFGFVCYWSGINRLWKITGSCWMDYFEIHKWSNVACVSYEHQPALAAQMEQVFEDTLVDGTYQ